MKLGRRLAPIAPWGDFGQKLDSNQFELVGGLQRLVMRHNSKTDGARVETIACIEPSLRLEGQDGEYMKINTQYALTNLENGHGSTEAVSLMAKEFEKIINASDAIISSMMEEGQKNEL